MSQMAAYVATEEEKKRPVEMPQDTGVKVPNTFYVRHGKRILDILLSGIALLIIWPILLIISLIVLIEFGRPILFPMDRPGLNGKIFRIYKFHDLNDKKGPNGDLLPPEQRTTKIGSFLRASSLDELPQLLNILKGDMSIIGPRPLLKIYLPRYNDRQMMRHAVRPGLECPSLVKRDHVRTWEEQFEDDVWYVEHMSLAVDVRMVLGVVKMMIDRKDTKRRGEATREEFMGAEG